MTLTAATAPPAAGPPAAAPPGWPPGPATSRDELVTRYGHLVKFVVGRLGVSLPGVFDREDALQAGAMGLLRAIDGFRPGGQASFESYAIVRIRGAILDAVRALDTVGRAGREAGRAIQRAIADLEGELGRDPTEAEIAARLKTTVARYREQLQAASFVVVSLHQLDDRDDNGESVADVLADPDAVDPSELATRRDAVRQLAETIAGLPERRQLLLSLYYRDELTFREIGEVLGVTESRICQLHTETILALRARLGIEPVRPQRRRRAVA